MSNQEDRAADKQITIIVDKSESASGIPSYLTSMKEVNIEIAELSCGDYVLGDGVICERKAAVDFIASIFDRRLFVQAKKMQTDYDKIILLTEGDIYATQSSINPDALRGAISYLSVLEGFSLVYTHNATETASLLATMARHLQHGLGYEIPLRGNKPKDARVISQFIVEGLPSIGPSKAIALLQHFGSVDAVFAASPQDLTYVEGIGKQLAIKIYDAVRAKY